MSLISKSKIALRFSKSVSILLESGSKVQSVRNYARITEKSKVVFDVNKCAILSSIRPLHSAPAANVGKKQATKLAQKAKKYESQSSEESDSDLEAFGGRGNSELWRKKIRTFHAILDVNKDGVISYDDFKLLAERFIDLGHLSPRHTHEFRGLLEDLWHKRFGEINAYNLVTVEQFLEDMHHVINDKKLARKAHAFLPYFFRAVDKDQSGAITVDEFKLFFECLALKEEDALLAFRLIDTDGDGKITLKEFVKHGRDFFLTEDENRISKYFWGPLLDH